MEELLLRMLVGGRAEILMTRDALSVRKSSPVHILK